MALLQNESMPLVDDSEVSGDLFRTCQVTSVVEMRKKGHVLVELMSEDTSSMQIVSDLPEVVVGRRAVVALPGAAVAGKLVRRQKIAGEWSEGVIVHLVSEDSVCAREISTQDEREEAHVDGHNGESDDDAVSVADQVLPSASELDGALPFEIATGSLYRVSGDASKAQFGKGYKVIAHVCNDQGRWGKGFVMAITDTWGKGPGKMYRKWYKAGAKAGFGLGRVQLVKLTDKVSVANIIGQTGIKTGSKGPPVRYQAIQEGLDAVCRHAAIGGVSVHMPRIGSGLAGGEWPKIESIVQAMIEKYGIDVYVYDFSA